RGNHDKVAAGIDSPDAFNPAALQAAAWTFEALTDANRAWLRALPRGPVPIDEVLEICHGSPDDEDEYLFSVVEALPTFAAMSRPVCFFGHTHVAVAYSTCENRGEIEVVEPDLGTDRTVIAIQSRRQYLINPGA